MKQTIFNSKAFSRTRKEIQATYPYIIKQGYGKELKRATFNIPLQWKFLWSNTVTMGNLLNIMRDSFSNIVTIMFIYKLYPAIYSRCDKDDFYFMIFGIKRGEFSVRRQAMFLADVIGIGEIEVDI